MNICFVGLGSIARRHIRNLHTLYSDISIDVLRHTGSEIIPEDVSAFISNWYTSKLQLKRWYDAVFITNPTSMHYKTLKEMADYSKNFFIEKPVFETGDESIDALPIQSGGVYYVACPLRYTNVIQYLKKNIDFSKVFSMRVISSSYLPEWRPGVDYRSTYSARKVMGGGVSIDLIHEWDYLYYLLGEPQRVYSIIAKKSNLEIDSDDIAIYIAEYESMTVEIHLDYFGRIPIRKMELFCEDDMIEADLIKQKVSTRKNGGILDLAEERDSYQKKELRHFFSIVNGEIKNDNTIEGACRVLKTARGDALKNKGCEFPGTHYYKER